MNILKRRLKALGWIFIATIEYAQTAKLGIQLLVNGLKRYQIHLTYGTTLPSAINVDILQCGI